LGVWENEPERERCRRRGRSPEPATPEEPIVDGSPLVNPSEAIFGEAKGDFRWVFDWSTGEDGWAGERRRVGEEKKLIKKNKSRKEKK